MRTKQQTIRAPATPTDVKAAFAQYPRAIQRRLSEVRKTIFAVAADLGDVGPLTETLKWGEPAYLTAATKSGSTIRLGWKAARPDDYALYFNCQTSLVDTFRTLFPEGRYEGNRAVLFNASEDYPEDLIAQCVSLALTYHRQKRKR